MIKDELIKKYPTTTSEVAEMLGIHAVAKDLPMATFASHGDLPVADLPVAMESEHPETGEKSHAKPELHSAFTDLKNETQIIDKNKFVKIIRAGLPYVAVFSVGLFLYYFFFTGVNFNALFNSKPKATTPKQSALAQLQSGDLTAYYSWISGFYYHVSDPKILGPESDNSGNGLSNFQKYLFNLNPKTYDTLGLGQADSQTLASGFNPISGVPLTGDQKAKVEKYIDMEVAMNRLALNRLQSPQQVAGAGTNTSGNTFFSIRGGQTGLNQYPGQNALSNSDSNLIGAGIDVNTNIPGRLEVPSLNINVPIIWTKDTNSFAKDLETGVAHYPGTALPGQIGTTYISGHSSNYVWSNGDFNTVFSKLGDLADNTSFKITVVQANGKDAIFHYVVTHRNEYLPTDQEQFANSGQSVVALSTCWPINTTAKRLVVFGILTQTEK